MANGFSNMTFTTNGLNLLAKAQAGAQLNFTRIAVGSGTCSDPSALNELISEKMSLNISQIVVNGTMATLCSFLDNATLVTGFDWKEIGIFATDPDIGEILYGWAGSGSGMISIPAGTTSVFTTPLNIGVMVSNATNVTATINSSLAFLAQNGDASNVTASFTPASVRANLTTGDKLSISLGKIKKWFADLGSAAFTDSSAYDAAGAASSAVSTHNTTAGAHSALFSALSMVYAAISHTHTAAVITDFAATVRGTALTGLSTTTNAIIATGDSILAAVGKLQAQITANLTTLTNHTGNTSNPHSTTAAQVGAATVTNVQSYINRTTAVNAADTNYTTFMARGESLNTTDTTPSANGEIAWTYA